MAKPLLYDSFGAELRLEQRVPDRQAEMGRVRDPWAGRVAGEVTPESLASALSGRSSLQQVMLLAAKMLEDDHVFACMRNLALAASRLPWEILPFDESDAAKKDAELVREALYGMGRFKKLLRYLVFGEYYPLAGAQLVWSAEFKPAGWENVDPWRWAWDDATNALRLLTLREQTKGESIQRRGFAIHSASLEPGPVRRRGLWRKIAWLWLFKNFTWPAWVRFAEAFGNPYILAYFARPEDKDSVLDAVVAMDANARGVFPEGTRVELKEAQRYGTTALYETLKRAAEEGMTKVILGHVLATDAKSGTGTLAGNAAADVAQANLEGVAEGMSETIQEDIVTPLCEWQLGAEQVARRAIPSFVIKSTPPADQEKKGKVYVTVNEALAKVGLAIDPSQIEDEFGVRTVPAATAAPTTKGEAAVAARRRLAAKAPAIRTGDDVAEVTRGIVARAAREMTEAVEAKLGKAETIGEFADAIWEAYSELDTTRLASALRDASVAANLAGRGDAS